MSESKNKERIAKQKAKRNKILRDSPVTYNQKLALRKHGIKVPSNMTLGEVCEKACEVAKELLRKPGEH